MREFRIPGYWSIPLVTIKRLGYIIFHYLLVLPPKGIRLILLMQKAITSQMGFILYRLQPRDSRWEEALLLPQGNPLLEEFLIPTIQGIWSVHRFVETDLLYFHQVISMVCSHRYPQAGISAMKNFMVIHQFPHL
ncbi:hypothetical protein D3C85_800300 [compost metagenome]